MNREQWMKVWQEIDRILSEIKAGDRFRIRDETGKDVAAIVPIEDLHKLEAMDGRKGVSLN